jgi:hypothetical protein
VRWPRGARWGETALGVAGGALLLPLVGLLAPALPLGLLLWLYLANGG